MKPIEEIQVSEPVEFPGELTRPNRPLIMRGLAADWAIVQAARKSDEAADAYIRNLYNDRPVTISVGGPDAEGRIFYNEDMTALNFETRRGQLDDVLDEIHRCKALEKPPVHYVGSITVDAILPGFRDENDLEFNGVDPMIRIWIGNRTRIASHYDITDNVACVAVGRRRFTLFPPDQLKNLYIGRLDLTPAGQSISLVDLNEPDFDRFPRFREALEHGQYADLEPGDAIFVPSMWWHNVEGQEMFNILVNYWWRDVPAYLGTPLDVLNHALLGIRDLPQEQRDAWRGIFEHYVFSPDDDVAAHIPEHARGVLAPITDTSARRLRALLMKNLNR